jgi:glycosyltransferase involved in cell wall biosynthesis
MRILLVVHGFPPHEASGTELHVAALADALAAAGHDAHVFAGSHTATRPLHERATHGPVDVERFARPVPRLRLRFHDDEVERALLAAVDRVRPDVVHVQHLLGLTAPLAPLLRARGIPVALTLHDVFFLCPEIQPFRDAAHPLRGELWGLNCFAHLELARPRRLAHALARGDLVGRARTHVARARTMRRELEAANALLVPSRFLRDAFVRFGVPRERLRVTPHGVAPFPQPPRAARDGGDVVVGYLGPLLHGKGVDLLVRAFRAVDAPAARLVVRGPEPVASFARHVRGLAAGDARIAFEPPVERAEVGAFLASLDLLVVPSRLHESFSLVTREAFAVGTPVLASDAGALPEAVVAGRNGALFAAGSARALRAGLEPLLRDPAALRRLDDFPPVRTVAEQAAELAELYAGLAGQPRAK